MANLGENLTAQMQDLVEKGVALAIHAKKFANVSASLALGSGRR